MRNVSNTQSLRNQKKKIKNNKYYKNITVKYFGNFENVASVTHLEIG